MAENRSYGKVDQYAIDIGDESKISKICKKCIFRVPKVLRRQNPEAYTPDVVTLGPFHFRRKRVDNNEEATQLKEGKEDFLLMERVKESYLNEILQEMKNISLKTLTQDTRL